jgi:hypothetical protein
MNNISLSRDAIEDFQSKTQECPYFVKQIIAEKLLTKWGEAHFTEAEYITSHYRNEKYSGFSLKDRWPDDSSSVDILCKNKKYMISRDARKENFILQLYDKNNKIITNFKGITEKVLAIASAYKEKDFFYMITSKSTESLPPHTLMRVNIITQEYESIIQFPADTFWNGICVDLGNYFITATNGNLYAYDKKSKSTQTLLYTHVHDIICHPKKTYIALLMASYTKEVSTTCIVRREENLLHALAHSIVLDAKFNSPVIQFIGVGKNKEILVILEAYSDTLYFFESDTGKMISRFKLPFCSSTMYRDKDFLYLQKIPVTIRHMENKGCFTFLVSYPLWFIHSLIEYRQK